MMLEGCEVANRKYIYSYKINAEKQNHSIQLVIIFSISTSFVIVFVENNFISPNLLQNLSGA